MTETTLHHAQPISTAQSFETLARARAANNADVIAVAISSLVARVSVISTEWHKETETTPWLHSISMEILVDVFAADRAAPPARSYQCKVNVPRKDFPAISNLQAADQIGLFISAEHAVQTCIDAVLVTRAVGFVYGIETDSPATEESNS